MENNQNWAKYFWVIFTQYNSIKSLENQNWRKCNMKKMAVRKYYGHF